MFLLKVRTALERKWDSYNSSLRRGELMERALRRDGKRPRPVFREWEAILNRLTRREIASFLVSETPMCKRLRQSSPFLGVLSKAELDRIEKRYAKG